MARKNNETPKNTIETTSTPAPSIKKHIQIVMLPPRPQMREGHILRLATETDAEGNSKVIWSNKSSHRDTAEFNTALTNVKMTANEKGYSYSEYISCFGSYQSGRNQFARDPWNPNLERDLAIVQRIMQPRPQQQIIGDDGQNCDVI
jgi:hypothetical protein